VTGSAKRIDAGLKEKIDAELREIAKQTEALLKDLRALSARGSAKKRPSGDIPRPSPLDELIGEMKATADLREDGGNLSAEKIADLFGLSRKRLAELLRRTRQGVHRTPDAESLQRPLEYFERIARLRVALGGSAREQGASFRKWLKTPNARLGRERPLDWICARRWQAMADLVDDILSGSPS
jgi:transcriptional regulator with XRE-family HTH domain